MMQPCRWEQGKVFKGQTGVLFPPTSSFETLIMENALGCMWIKRKLSSHLKPWMLSFIRNEIEINITPVMENYNYTCIWKQTQLQNEYPDPPSVTECAGDKRPSHFYEWKHTAVWECRLSWTPHMPHKNKPCLQKADAMLVGCLSWLQKTKESADLWASTGRSLSTLPQNQHPKPYRPRPKLKTGEILKRLR